MLCQNCGKNEVNFKYTQIINGVKKEVQLCDKCAKELGISDVKFNIPMDFSSFLGDFFSDYSDGLLPSFIESEISKCPTCGMTFEDFSKTGKFGCGDCYNTFEDKIDMILKNIQGSNIHTGRKGMLIEEAKSTENKIKEEKEDNSKVKNLKEDLKKAIKEENYEEAAKLRDKIREIEGK